MYYYIKGIIKEILEKSIVIDNNGIGYEVLVSNPSSFVLDTPQTLYVKYYLKEDENFLIGFVSKQEKELFNDLIKVKGIGPKSAISMFGGAPINKIIDAINSSDLVFLKSLPGIGAKSASQIILDLRGKLSYSSTSKTGNKVLDDVFSALKSMGFKDNEIIDALNKVDKHYDTCEDYLKVILKHFNKNF